MATGLTNNTLRNVVFLAFAGALVAWVLIQASRFENHMILVSDQTKSHEQKTELSLNAKDATTKRDLPAGEDAVTEANIAVEESTLLSTPSPMRETTINVDQWITHVKRSHKKPNIVLILTDNIHPYTDTQSFLDPGIVTPNLNNLAAEGLVFRRAYCQISLSNPSRASLITSRRPDTTTVYNATTNFRRRMPDVVTIPQYFRQNGFYSVGVGDIFHKTGEDVVDKQSWSEPMRCLDDPTPEGSVTTPPTAKLFFDDCVTNTTKKMLKELSDLRKPFFLAVGLKQPSPNWNATKSLSENYADKNVIDENLTRTDACLKSFDPINNTNYGKDEEEEDDPESYCKAVSYVDDLLGEILSELNILNLTENTIVAFTSNHGYHMGEQYIKGKESSFEVANRVPLVIKVPGVTDHGMTTDKLVELVDLFPTLVDLTASKPVPTCTQGPEKCRLFRLCTEGNTLLPLFLNQTTDLWKDSVFSQRPRTNGTETCMGYTVQTDTHRLTRWVQFDTTQLRPNDCAKVCSVELYDFKSDPSERDNLTGKKEFQQIEADMEVKWFAGWRVAMQI